MNSFYNFTSLFPTNLYSGSAATSLKFTDKSHNSIIHFSTPKCKILYYAYL